MKHLLYLTAFVGLIACNEPAEKETKTIEKSIVATEKNIPSVNHKCFSNYSETETTTGEESIEDFIIKSTVFIELDSSSNIIYPNATINILKKIPYSSQHQYIPLKIENDWMQIKNSDTTSTPYGWIKWRESDCILIDYILGC